MEDNTAQTVEETTSQKPGEETPEPTVAELQERLAKAEESNKQLYARLKKQDGAPKEEQEQKAQPQAETLNNVDNLDLMEFFAQGNTKEDYNQLQVIMKGQGISLSEAQKHPLYTGYKAQTEAARKAEQAQVLGSSGATPKNESEFKSGMTPEEHKAAWKKAQGIA